MEHRECRKYKHLNAIWEHTTGCIIHPIIWEASKNLQQTLNQR